MNKSSNINMNHGITVTEDTFGEIFGSQTVRRFTLLNPASGAQVQIINYGATITSIKVPDRIGQLGDVVLGYDTIEGYLGVSNPYLGATVGRVANRTKEGKFTLEGRLYSLSINNGPNHLHGGRAGFDKKMWEARVDKEKGNRVVMSYLSHDGEEGYPGDLLVNVTFEWTRGHELIIKYQATTTKPTLVNLTNHSYFNLAGHDSSGLKGHFIQLNAEAYTPLDCNMIPTGDISSVQGTVYDLRSQNNTLFTLLESFPPGPNGYDTNFCINKTKHEGVELVALAQHSGSGRVMEVSSDQPGVQLYTANFFPDGDDKGILGKKGAVYKKHAAFCLETQNYPDAINQKTNFPDAVLYPGNVYKHSTYFKFFTMVKST